MSSNLEDNLDDVLIALQDIGGISPTLDKVILDIQNDLQAMLDLLLDYSKLRADLITQDDFRASYNIYRSKRGAIGHED